MKKIALDVCALRHPIEPKSACGPVDVIVPNRHIARDPAKGATQTSHDASLLAMGDRIVADKVMADVRFVPSVQQRAFDSFDIALSRVGRGVIECITVLSQRNAGTDRIADVVALDDPAFAPVRADQSDLFSRGRCPRRRSVAQNEASNRQVVDARFDRIENRLSNIDLHILHVRIDMLELRPDRRAIPIHLPEPERRSASA